MQAAWWWRSDENCKNNCAAFRIPQMRALQGERAKQLINCISALGSLSLSLSGLVTATSFAANVNRNGINFRPWPSTGVVKSSRLTPPGEKPLRLEQKLRVCVFLSLSINIAKAAPHSLGELFCCIFLSFMGKPLWWRNSCGATGRAGIGGRPCHTSWKSSAQNFARVEDCAVCERVALKLCCCEKCELFWMAGSLTEAKESK